MTDCPHGNTAEERCAQCVAAGRGQPGDHYARRYRSNAAKQFAADDDLKRRNEIQLKRRHEAEKARVDALKSQEQRLEYEQES